MRNESAISRRIQFRRGTVMQSGKRLMIALPTGVVVAAVLSAMAWPARSICAVGREWLPEANAPLKVTFSSMAACTQPERKIIYRYLSMEQRKELWRSHWSSFLGEGTKLNAKQQATLRM